MCKRCTCFVSSSTFVLNVVFVVLRRRVEAVRESAKEEREVDGEGPEERGDICAVCSDCCGFRSVIVTTEEEEELEGEAEDVICVVVDAEGDSVGPEKMKQNITNGKTTHNPSDEGENKRKKISDLVLTYFLLLSTLMVVMLQDVVVVVVLLQWYSTSKRGRKRQDQNFCRDKENKNLL